MRWLRFRRLVMHAPFPFSFKQLLGASFAGILILLGGALGRALVAVDTLSRDSRDFPAKALQRSGQVRELQETTIALERQVRQYLVLHDPSLRTDIRHSWMQSLAVLKKLDDAGPVDLVPLTQQWRALAAANIPPLLEEHSERMSIPTAQLDAVFHQLGQLDQQLDSMLQTRLAEQDQSLLLEFERQRQVLINMGVTASSLALVLALGLGAWLSRSFAQLDRAIRQLGQSQQIPLKPLGGPTDIRQLGERVRWVQQRLADLESDKLQFMRHISHELKTPLANLREGVALLEEQVPGPVNEAQREILVILRENSLALQHQIEGLLQYNAAASGAQYLQKHWVDVRTLLENLVTRQRLQIQAKSLQVRIEGTLARVWLDPDKWETVAGNLLVNAIRFSPVSGLIRLTLSEGKENWKLTIQDQGPGVDPQDASHIFDPFYQGKRQPAGARKGSGVGLSIVRALVQAHGGGVSLIPQENGGGGAVFCVEMPRDTGEAGSQRSKGSKDQA